MAGSTSCTGAATAISGGSIPRSTWGAAVLGSPPDERRGVAGAGVMEVADLLVPRGVIAQLRVTNKKGALQDIARRAASLTGVAERRIYDVLAERERLGSTGIGRGIAIPHGKLTELTRLYGL